MLLYNQFILKIFFCVFLVFAEDSPGGDSSSNDWSRNSFSHPMLNATNTEKQFFGVGNSFFKLPWVEYPSSTVGRDGLGPLFNAISCAACHVNDGRGVGYINDRVNLSILFRLGENTPEGQFAHKEYGAQLQPFGIQGVAGEARVSVIFQYIQGTYPDGTAYELRKPEYSFNNFSGSSFDHKTQISPRVANHMVGLGLIEAIDPKDILQNSDPEDLDGDGISGRANFVLNLENSQTSLGLFGWKASQPTLKQQNAAAFNGDMGLTTSLFPEQNCTVVQLDCLNKAYELPFEVDDKILDRVTLYTQIIAVPKSRNTETIDFIEGKKTFSQIGCIKCHTDRFTTSNFHSVSALHAQKISPYSDFLLHDMGSDLADGVIEGLASGEEWRTPPLWSIGLINTVNRHTNLLHDNRARNVEEAILWHGGEALLIKNKFMKLNKLNRDQLIFFVESI